MTRCILRCAKEEMERARMASRRKGSFMVMGFGSIKYRKNDLGNPWRVLTLGEFRLLESYKRLQTFTNDYKRLLPGNSSRQAVFLLHEIKQRGYTGNTGISKVDDFTTLQR